METFHPRLHIHDLFIHWIDSIERYFISLSVAAWIELNFGFRL